MASSESDSSLSSDDSLVNSYLELDAPLSVNYISWLDAVKLFVTETNSNSLYVGSTNLEANEIEPFMAIIPNSKITELNLEHNDLKCVAKPVARALVNSPITRLSLHNCSLNLSDILSVLKILKKTQITDLDVSSNELPFDLYYAEKLSSHLEESLVTKLSIGGNEFNEDAAQIFSRALKSTKITSLNLANSFFDHCGLILLFRELPHTLISDLNLSNTVTIDTRHIGAEDEIIELSFSLAPSKLVRLDLSDNEIRDKEMKSLARGLQHSKIVELNLKNNRLRYLDFLSWLNHSNLQFLNISGNPFGVSPEIIEFLSIDLFGTSSLVNLSASFCKFNDESGQEFVKRLKYSQITKLDVSGNEFKEFSVAECVHMINLEYIDLSSSNLPINALITLGDSISESNLKYIDLSSNFDSPLGAKPLAEFIEKTVGSRIETLKLKQNNLNSSGIKFIASSLLKTTLTHLDLSSNMIGNGVKSLAAILKFTVITNLDLSSNEIRNEEAEIISECIKETQIIELNLSSNKISNLGAVALVVQLKNTSLYLLKMKGNEIDHDGLEIIAKIIEGTFVTDLETGVNGCKSPVDKFLWENRVSAQKLISFFKLEILPDLECNNFCFDCNAEDVDVQSLLDKWLYIYKIISEKPSAMNALAQDEGIPFSRRQIAKKFLEEFPQQLTLFFGRRVEASTLQHVWFLERIEKLGLSKIVELLLLNRPVFIIDKSLNILHPYVYKLMHKYKQPIFSEIEPEGKNKIIEYLIQHSDLEAAAEVIEILSA